MLDISLEHLTCSQNRDVHTMESAESTFDLWDVEPSEKCCSGLWPPRWPEMTRCPGLSPPYSAHAGHLWCFARGLSQKCQGAPGLWGQELWINHSCRVPCLQLLGSRLRSSLLHPPPTPHPPVLRASWDSLQMVPTPVPCQVLEESSQTHSLEPRKGISLPEPHFLQHNSISRVWTGSATGHLLPGTPQNPRRGHGTNPLQQE